MGATHAVRDAVGSRSLLVWAPRNRVTQATGGEVGGRWRGGKQEVRNRTDQANGGRGYAQDRPGE